MDVVNDHIGIEQALENGESHVVVFESFHIYKVKEERLAVRDTIDWKVPMS